MSGFLRSKQTGIEKDVSSGITSGIFQADDRVHYGISSRVSCMAYDPVQSLLALGTVEDDNAAGKLYIFGQRRVQKILELPRPTSITQVFFTANKLLSFDKFNELTLWDLDAGKRLSSSIVAGIITSVVADPYLDWVFVGLMSGEILAYDLEHRKMAPKFRLPNFWKQLMQGRPYGGSTSLVSLALHPRDIGQLLIGYSHGAVIYSLAKQEIIKQFEYTIEPGAPGPTGTPTPTARKPKLTHALWHPSGTFILTAHQDGSLVFWDYKEQRIILSRSLNTFDIHTPGAAPQKAPVVEPYTRIAWCCKQNGDESGLLIVGGKANDDPDQGLVFLDFGATPLYGTSSWQSLNNYFRGKSRTNLAIPPGVRPVEFTLIPRESPHYAGAHDPIGIFCLMNSGALVTMSFPSGYPINPTNQLHPSLTFIHPFITNFSVASIERNRWLGFEERRNRGEAILRGGLEEQKPLMRHQARTIVQAAHADGKVRLWDSGHHDQIENPHIIEIDVARTLCRHENVVVTAMDLANETGEMGVGTSMGEVMVYRWGFNTEYQRPENWDHRPNPGGFTETRFRADPTVKQGLLPFTLYEMNQGPISAVNLSDVGFMAVASEGGHIHIVDLRGPATILPFDLGGLTKKEKKGGLFHRSKDRPSSSQGGAQALPEHGVVISFGIVNLEGDDYASICCFVGTNTGRLLTFKILPDSDGRYRAVYSGFAQFEGRIVSIDPIHAASGRPADATSKAMADLRLGVQVNAVLVVATHNEVRIFRPVQGKGTHKSFDGASLCYAACVVTYENDSFALMGVFGDQTCRVYSLPALRELAVSPLRSLHGSRIYSSLVTRTGSIFGWAGPTELAVLNIWGSGQELPLSQDILVNPQAVQPPRPTISNMEWLGGVQYITPIELDQIIGGPERVPSKRMRDATSREQGFLASMTRSGTGSSTPGGKASGASSSAASSSQEGWGQYLTRQFQERAEKVKFMNDGATQLEEASSQWAESTSKFVRDQKRNLLMKSVTGKFT